MDNVRTKVSHQEDSMTLTQQKFIKELLLASDVEEFKHVVTPLALNTKLSANVRILLENPTLYRSIREKLNFLTNTRPDLTYIVQILSQFMQNPRSSHWNALLHTLNNMYSTCGQGIKLKAQDKLILQAYSNSDWGTCIDTRNSIT